MQLYFIDTDFDVVIGANPFDDIKVVADAVIHFIKDKNESKLISSLKRAGAMVEMSDHDDVICEYNKIDGNNSDPCVTHRFTIKTTGEGKLDVNDNDKLHKQWLDAFKGYLHPKSVEIWSNKIGISKFSAENDVRILLLKILPGLGKSYLGINHVNFVDYEDWVTNRNSNYKDRKGDDVIEDIERIVNEIAINAPHSDVYICSSIAWEDFETNILQSSLYVHMKHNEYNCNEVNFRGRPDLCEKFGATLIQWNNDYETMKIKRDWKFAEYILYSEEYLNKDRIVELLSDFPGYVKHD